MREFNNARERELIKALFNKRDDITINLGEYLAYNILKKDRCIKIDAENINLIFNTEKDNLKSFINNLQIIISLIESLKDDKLIFTHDNSMILENSLSHSKIRGQATVLTGDNEFGANINAAPQNYIEAPLPTTLTGYIKKYIGQYCYIRPEFVDYIINGFKTHEKIRYEKTIFWTRVAAVLAFIGLIIAILSSIQSHQAPMTASDSVTTTTERGGNQPIRRILGASQNGTEIRSIS